MSQCLRPNIAHLQHVKELFDCVGRFPLKLAYCIRFVVLAFALVCQSVEAQSDSEELVKEYDRAIWQHSLQVTRGENEKTLAAAEHCMDVASRIFQAGEARGLPELKARGLIRKAYSEYLLDQSSKLPQQMQAQCFDLASACGSGSVPFVEYLAYYGHLAGTGQVELDSTEGIRKLEEAIRISQEIKDDRLLVVAHNFLAESLYVNDQFRLSQDYALRGLAIAEDSGDAHLEKVALTAVVVVCWQNNGLDASLPYAKRLFAIDHESSIARNMIRMASKDVETVDQMSVELDEIRAQPITKDAVYRFIGLSRTLSRVFENRGELKKALHALETADVFFESAGKDLSLDSHPGKWRYMLRMAELRLQLGESVENLDQLESLVPEERAHFRLQIFSNRLADICVQVGDYRRATKWFKTSAMCREALDAIGHENSEVAAQNYLAVEQRFRAATVAAENQTQRAYYLYVGMICTAVLLVTSAAYSFLRNRMLKDNELLLQKLVDEKTEMLTEAFEEAEKSKEAKSEFLAKFNHEIRSPLTAIVGYSELLEHRSKVDSEKSDPTDSYLNGICSASDHLLGIVNDVLDMSKVEKGCVDFSNSHFTVGSMVSEMQHLLYAPASRKDISLQINCREGDVTIFSDKSRIKQIIVNLANNAIEFTNTGTVEINVNSDCTEDRSGISVSVRDTGCGIKEAEFSQIFEPFFQGSARRNGKGTGLGLNIVKNLVDALGGTIEFDSQVGVGTNFRVFLPVEVAQIESSNEISDAQACSDKVLVVDDQHTAREAVCLLLQTQGFLARDTDSAVETLRIIKDWRPQFVLLDLRMPETSGFEVLKSIHENVFAPPICIALTGDATTTVKQQCIEAGFDGFLTKPMRIASVVELIQRLREEKPSHEKFHSNVS